MTRSREKALKILLLSLSVLASLKMLFFAVTMDEEYQVVMSYRNAIGDQLFLNMWEPHQSSAFLCTLLMKPYLMLFGTTGIVLYLRAWGILLHLGVSIYLSSVLKDFLGKKQAWLLALLYYNIIPKQIMLPEFGILQVWCFTLLSLFLMQYYVRGKNRYLVLSAMALALNVLSYPSCLLLFPFVLLALARLSGKRKWRDMGIFTLVCGICAAAYLGMLLCNTPPGRLLETLGHILKGDITHTLSLTGKLWLLFQKALRMAALWGICRLLSLAAARYIKLEPMAAHALTILPACVIQLFCWVILNAGSEYLNLHLTATAIAGLSVCSRSFSCRPKREGADPALLLCYGVIGALLSLLSVLYLTDITLTESIPHAMPAAVYGAALLLLAASGNLNRQGGKDCSGSPGWQDSQGCSGSPDRHCQEGRGLTDAGHRQAERTFKWVNTALLALLLTAIFGKGYTLRGGDYGNVLQSGGIMKEGPAAGTISNYIRAYVYNSEYENWKTYVQDGDRVLVVTNQVQTLGTIQYLFKDVEVCHYSVVNPTPYDERLLEYWELYPEKAPNVIVVDCWYGTLRVEPDSWIMHYIEKDFGYTKIDEKEYIRIYRK